MRDGRMHQTTVRFGPDLWEALEVECSMLGMSAAQFVREAALARLNYMAGRRGDPEFDEALRCAGASLGTGADPHIRFDAAQARTTENRDGTLALAAQGDLARRRAEEVRAESLRLRGVSEAARQRMELLRLSA